MLKEPEKRNLFFLQVHPLEWAKLIVRHILVHSKRLIPVYGNRAGWGPPKNSLYPSPGASLFVLGRGQLYSIIVDLYGKHWGHPPFNAAIRQHPAGAPSVRTTSPALANRDRSQKQFDHGTHEPPPSLSCLDTQKKKSLSSSRGCVKATGIIFQGQNLTQQFSLQGAGWQYFQKNNSVQVPMHSQSPGPAFSVDDSGHETRGKLGSLGIVTPRQGSFLGS